MNIKYFVLFLIIISCTNNDAQEGDSFYNNKDYINAIEYSNSQSISEFYEKILANINTNKENLYLDFHIIKKWLEYTNQIKSSISHSFSWDEFHDISDNFINNHQNCEIENLIKEIEYFLGDIEQNTNPKFSLMNMFINSHNYLN